MRRVAPLVAAFLFLSETAIADDTVTIYGNYYKERSTRIYEPTLLLTKDLPESFDLEATLGVDQITSASGAFTPEDKVISELREEAEIKLHKKLDDTFRPGIEGRVSYEPDYTSVRAGLDLEITLFRDQTSLLLFGQYQRDWVRERRGMVDDDLFTTLFGASVTQIVAPEMLAGASLEGRILRGYLENVYRPEKHPRERNRYSATAWASYFIGPTASTVRASYCFAWDSWELKSHTIDFELQQQVVDWFELIGRFRYYTQGEAFFAHTMQPYNTMDPKLFKYDVREYGIGLRLPLRFLGKTALDTFAGSSIEPLYTYYQSGSAYGPAHIAQLGWYWPF